MPVTTRTITVLGAGSFGLWQAYALARAGHRVRLLEASAEPFARAASLYGGVMLAPEREGETAPPPLRRSLSPLASRGPRGRGRTRGRRSARTSAHASRQELPAIVAVPLPPVPRPYAVTAIRTPVRNATEIESALDAFAAEPNGGLVVVPESVGMAVLIASRTKPAKGATR